MNNSCLTAEKIEAYLNSANNSDIRKEIDKHLVQCIACRTIMAAAKLGQPKTFVQAINETDNLLSSKKPSVIENGQIWRLNRDEKADKNPTVIITNNFQDNLDAVIAYINPKSEFISKDDVVVKADESPIGIDFLAECWNQKSIKYDQLESYIGEVSPTALAKVKEALKNSVSAANALVEEFRAHQIEIYSKLGKTITESSKLEIICDELFGANEVLAMAAATFPVDKLKKLLQAKDKNYSIRQYIGKPYFTIYRKDNTPFRLTISSESQGDITRNSDENGQLFLDIDPHLDRKSFKGITIETINDQ